MKEIDKEKYFKMLADAENNHQSLGVVVSKKRFSGMENVSREWASIKIKEGKTVGIAMKEENQDYIESYIDILKNKFGADCQYRKLYSTRFTEDGIVEDKDKFIGYELTPK